MKINIVITTSFPALHNWPDCNIPEMDFIKNTHRHVFHVTIKIGVSPKDRDIEFISKKDEIESYISEMWWNKDLGSSSCENLATQLYRKFNANYVLVSEDGENGAEVYND